MDAQSDGASTLWQSIMRTHSPSNLSNPISDGIVPFKVLFQRDRSAAQTVQQTIRITGWI
jgi:hypothetical protein